jgi:hypothetical protein
MTERRCPECEALVEELDCLECVWYAQHRAAVRVMGEPFGALEPAGRTHCLNGHEMTEANTRIDSRSGSNKRIMRTCRACLRQRVINRRDKRQVEVE